MMNFSMIIKILQGTPLWVYGIFAYLLWVGINASKQRTLFIPILFILPTVLFGLKVDSLFKLQSTTLWLYFGSFLLVGAVIGWLQAAFSKVTIDKKTKSVTIPGSWQTLVLVLLVFTLKYYFGYMQAVHPEEYQSLLLVDVATSAAITGYFYGRVFNFMYQLVRA